MMKIIITVIIIVTAWISANELSIIESNDTYIVYYNVDYDLWGFQHWTVFKKRLPG